MCTFVGFAAARQQGMSQVSSAVKAGTEASADEAIFVRVENPQPVSEPGLLVGKRKRGQYCLILPEGKLTALAVHRNEVLVRYEPYWYRYAMGESDLILLQCPGHTVFFMKQSKFASLPGYGSNLKERSEREQFVEKVLGEKPDPDEPEYKRAP
jgi:hypothetical protein